MTRRCGSVVALALVSSAALTLHAGDCNGNGTPDTADIASGTSEDCNENRVPDECEIAPLPLGATGIVRPGGVARDVAVADFTQDGLPDIAVALGGPRSRGVALMTGTAEREFAVAGMIPLANLVYLVRWGDLDGDGRLDLIIGDAGGIRVCRGVEDRGFGPPVLISEIEPAALEVGDLNGDGAAEIVYADPVIAVIESHADWTFSTPSRPLEDLEATGLALGDLDGDGDPDLAVTDNGGLRILSNDGGAFAARIRVEARQPRLPRLADFDGDGLLDVAVVGASRVAVFLNGGVGRPFRENRFALATLHARHTGFAAGDVDGDGDVDLAVGLFNFDSRKGELIFVINRGDGALVTAVSEPLKSYPPALALADLDGDRDDDLLVAFDRVEQVRIHWNDEREPLPVAGVDLSQRRLRMSSYFEPHSSVLEDLDGDGDLDLATIDGENQLLILENDGAGTMRPSGNHYLRATSEMICIVAADLDGDGDLDLAGVDEFTHNLVTLVNNGKGKFVQHPEVYRAGGAPAFVCAADLDGDDFPDLVTANRGRNTVGIFLNDGDGSFAAERSVEVGSHPVGVTSGDFDGDGDIDVAVTNAGSAQLTVLKNDGAGVLGRPVNYEVGYPWHVTSGDFDNDGDVDLVTTQWRPVGLLLLFNGGDGRFDTRRFLENSRMPYSVIATDFDGDGLLDLVTANQNSNSVSLHLNRGKGHFAAPVHYPVGRDPRFVVAGDIDGDGDVDLVAANHSSLDLSVLVAQSRDRRPAPYLTEVCTEADFFMLSQLIPGDDHPVRLAKYIVAADDGDPDLPPVLFQNVGVHPLHQEFLAEVFPDRFPALTAAAYQELVGRRESRAYFTGAIFRRRAGRGLVYGFALVTDHLSDPSEMPTVAEVRQVHETLGRAFKLRPLVYAPDSRETRAAARDWRDPGFRVYLGEAAADRGYLAYTRAIGYGTVRVLTLAAFEEANATGEISFRDILVLERAPRDMEGVVGGVITAEPQGELSHLAVRTARRGTPNAFVAGALDAFRELDGKLIRLEVREGGYDAEAASRPEAETWWRLQRPRLSKTPAADFAHAGIDRLEDMDLSPDASPEARYGGKATSLARLQRVLDGPFARYRERGFAVPLRHYRDFLRANRIASAVDPARQVTYEEFLDEVLDWPAFLDDSRLRFATLARLREHMESQGIVDPSLVRRLGDVVEQTFGGGPHRVRFRSSSNVEDLLEFNGAGLYSSTSACVADDRDGDEEGPSLCDATKLDERGVAQALKKVWASNWNFRAYEERSYFGLPQDTAAMAVLVNRTFVDEEVNGVAFTGNPSRASDRRYVVTAQKGEVSVVSPEPGVTAEKNVLAVHDGRVEEIIRAVPSSLVPRGEFVLSDERLRELGALLWHLDRHYPVDTGGRERDAVLLDVEFKVESNGRLAVKQVRPFLHTTESGATPTFELEIPPHTVACGVFVRSRTLRAEHDLKSVLRFKSGRIPLPTSVESFTADLLDEVRVGPGRRRATARGPGTFFVSTAEHGDLRSYRFRYRQEFTLADGTPFEIAIHDLEFQGGDERILERSRVVDEEFLTRRLSLQGTHDRVITYSSCTYETLPLWEVRVDLEDGLTLRFLERHEPPPTPNDTGPAALVLAEIGWRDGERRVTDYWRLMYAALRHNVNPRYRVVFDEPLAASGLPGRLAALDVVFPEQRAGAGLPASVHYLDAHLEQIASPQVVSFRRERLDEPGVLFRRGDVVEDGRIDLADALRLLYYLFLERGGPICEKAADTNDDGKLDLRDPIGLVVRFFLAVAPFPPPFAECGADGKADTLACRNPVACW